jgi:hypothetical protein
VPPLPSAEPGETTAAAGTGAAQMLLAGPLAARSATDILVSLTIASGGPVNRATAEVVYDPLQLEAVGADASTPGRLPVRIEGSAVVRFRVRSAAGLVQVRVENIVGVDPAGAAVAVVPPQPLDITITP